MDGNYEKGQRLFVETEDETVEGEFHTMDADHKVITLKNCKLLPSGEVVEGMTRYYKNEIKDIRVLDPVPDYAANKESESAGNWDLMRKTYVKPSKVSEKVSPAQVVMNYFPEYNKTGGRRSRLTVAEYDEANKHIRNSVMIERKGRFFMDAISLIKTAHCVGVSIEGSTLGRSNPVTLMCISIPQRTFVFDIQSLGDKAFEPELKDILQSKTIEKVIHNCSLVSDCLFHQHGVTLRNVFDTQVADLVITKKIKGEFPTYAKSLPRCMATYLNIPEGFLYQHKVHQGYVGEDLGKWRQRPLPYELQKGIVKNTVFLLPLREKLLSKMLRTFLHGVNIFLNYIKNAEPEIAHDQMVKGPLVPRELLAINEEVDDDDSSEELTVAGNGFSSLKL